MSELGNVRINVIAGENGNLKISITASPKTTVARLKRTVEQEIYELYGVSMLVSVIEDSKGFALSNNSEVGDHLRHGDTAYVQTHKDKMGTNMNLPSNLTDQFMTLRYVSGSVVRRLLESEAQVSPLEVVPEIIHLGFWYSNIETVSNVCRLLNKIFTPESLQHYHRQAHSMQNTLLLKLLLFWFDQVQQSVATFPEVLEQLLQLLEKLSLNRGYAEQLKGNRLIKSVQTLSKDQLLDNKLKKLALQIIRNVAGKSGLNSKLQSGYLPSTLTDSSLETTNAAQVAEALGNGSQDDKAEALQLLIEHPTLINELSVRFDYYWKTTGLLLIRSIKDKTTARMFSQVIRSVAAHTSKEKAGQVMQRDFIKRIHNYLLDSHVESHPAVYEYYHLVAKESASKGVFNVQQASELIASPYSQFARISAEALAQMSDRKASPIRFLPSVKDFLRLSLKTQDSVLSACLMRTIGNLTLEEQCRYQIINLKGIEVFVKFLEIGESKNNPDLQRACAKGLLNLSISSRQVKARVLGLLGAVLERYYKGKLDSIAGSYIQNILRAPKT